MRFCNAATCSATASQSVAAPLAAISSGVSVCTLAGPSSAIGDGDAFAADVVEVELIFLLDAFAQVLHGHVLLRQFDFDRAALLLDFGQAPALFAQIFFARERSPFPALAFWPSKSAVCAFTCSRSCCSDSICARDSWISDSACSLRLMNERDFVAALLHQLREFANALFQRLLLLPERRAKLFLGREGHFAFGQRRVRRIALLPQIFQSRV